MRRENNNKKNNKKMRQLTKKEQEGWPRRRQLVDCFPKQKGRKQERKATDQLLNRSLAKKGTETGKGGQDMVDQPTVLPKMKGRRQETKTTGCDRSLNRLVAKKRYLQWKKIVSKRKIDEDHKLLNFFQPAWHAGYRHT